MPDRCLMLMLPLVQQPSMPQIKSKRQRSGGGAELVVGDHVHLPDWKWASGVEKRGNSSINLQSGACEFVAEVCIESEERRQAPFAVRIDSGS